MQIPAQEMAQLVHSQVSVVATNAIAIAFVVVRHFATAMALSAILITIVARVFAIEAENAVSQEAETPVVQLARLAVSITIVVLEIATRTTYAAARRFAMATELNVILIAIAARTFAAFGPTPANNRFSTVFA